MRELQIINHKSKIENVDALIFDMDGVLMDVSESYRAAIRQTTQIYFETGLGLAPFAGDLVSRDDVAAFKFADGFNNDWDLTTALVKYFLFVIASEAKQSPINNAGIASSHKPLLAMTQEILIFLRDASAHIHITVEELARRKDIPAFTRAVRDAGGGLDAVQKILGARGDELLFATGDPRATNLVKRIFEEIYLGAELFRDEYGESPRVHHGDGLIRRESLIPNLQSLQSLDHLFPLAIATGRPRNQATFALRATGIEKFFGVLVTHEDNVDAEEKHFAATGERASFGKPHPFSLLQAARAIAPENSRCAYIGDTLDDIRAAKAAGFIAIGCLAPAEDKTKMRAEFACIGADAVIENPDELVERLSD
ncbi:MAG: HAD hydrolase-like protein [Chloroflexi bacterium]|nr:HAD hydrolase-like protein [Chloroflexota bacterium]